MLAAAFLFAAGAMRQLPDLPEPRAMAVAAAAPGGTAVYVAGGRNLVSETYLASVAVLDARGSPGAWKWNEYQHEMTVARSRAVAVIYDGVLYVVGGRRCRGNPNCYLRSGDFLVLPEAGQDPSKGPKWQPLAEDMAEKRYMAHGSVFDGRLVVVGGHTSGGHTMHKSAEYYTFATQRWTLVPDFVPAACQVFAVVPGLVFVGAPLGRRPETCAPAEAEQHGFRQRLAPTVEMRRDAAATVYRHGAAYVIGGNMCEGEDEVLEVPATCSPRNTSVSLPAVVVGLPGPLMAAAVDLGSRGILVAGGIRAASGGLQPSAEATLIPSDALPVLNVSPSPEAWTTTSAPATKSRHSTSSFGTASGVLRAFWICGAVCLVVFCYERCRATRNGVRPWEAEPAATEDRRTTFLTRGDYLALMRPNDDDDDDAVSLASAFTASST